MVNMASEVKKCDCGKEYPKNFFVGDRVHIAGFEDEYIICVVAESYLNKVQLTNLRTGTIFNGCVNVNDIDYIEPYELEEMFKTYDNKLICPICLTEYKKTEYKKVEQTYKIGQRFKYRCADNYVYILCLFGVNKVGMVNIINGKRWGDGINVKDPYKITENELSNLFSPNTFELVQDVY